ncbi:MAG: glycosyltransferase [Chloroflexota bacterium]
MNILHITLGFLPAAAWGGPVQIVYNNAKELIRRGHRVTVYCTNLLDKHHKIRPHTFEDMVDGIRVVYFDAWRIPFWRGTLGPVWCPDLPSQLRRELPSFDVVHLNGYRSLMNLQVVSALGNAHPPLVVQPHGAMPVIVNSFFVKRLYDRLLGRRELGRAQAFIALQESEREQIRAHGVPAEKITVIPNGLDPSNYNLNVQAGIFRRRYDISTDKKLLLFLGRINRKKGVDMLIEAFARLRDMNAILVIAGPDDGQLDEVKTLIARRNLAGRVILTGLLTGDDVLNAYRDADLFVLPARTDTFPTTIMEACLMSVPMVITESVEIAHLLKDRAAEVVPFDATSFAEAMRRVLSDADLSRKYQAGCAELMREAFSITATVDRLEQLYRELLARNVTADR